MRVSPDDDFTLELELDELAAAADAPAVLARKLAARLGGSPAELPPLEIRKRSLDARHGRVRFHVVVGAAGTAPLGGAPVREGDGPPVVIVGGGPAGLFCAYELARAAIPSVIVDRGKPVQARRRDLKGLTQHGRVDPDSNYCFGEGGAGTYSDGKLYTRSHKRGDVRDVIEVLAMHGAGGDEPLPCEQGGSLVSGDPDQLEVPVRREVVGREHGGAEQEGGGDTDQGGPQRIERYAADQVAEDVDKVDADRLQ